jgi:hypothetical protein
MGDTEREGDLVKTGNNDSGHQEEKEERRAISGSAE